MKIVNLTPHSITVDGVGEIEPSGLVVRCATRRVALGTRGGMRVIAQSLGKVEGLPAPEEGTIYIVSSLVLGELPKGRRGVDVYAPDTGSDATRVNGQVVSVRGLIC